MFHMNTQLMIVVIITIILSFGCAASIPNIKDFLVTGRFRPSFDHIDTLNQQIDSVAGAGCTCTYAGMGEFVYTGIPTKVELEKILKDISIYNKKGHDLGVPIMLCYICPTSIVNAETFTKNWNDYAPDLPKDIDAQTLLQQDINGKNLPSWYGAPYNPADTWNPIVRQYHKFLIKLAIQSGHDGVFYDNPTVHPSGNYSKYAMMAWSKYLKKNKIVVNNESVNGLRQLTISTPQLWFKFRATELTDFLREIREYSRTLKPDFIVTANNSLNSYDSFYSQPRAMGYSIFNMSLAQDVVTVEDMSHTPRRAGMQYISYSPTMKMIHSLGHGKPLSVCTIADGDYTTPPNLMKLAIAECTANDAAYMVWACWDETYRKDMEKACKLYHDFLDAHLELFGNTTSVSDTLVIWPYENWLERNDCPTVSLTQYLAEHNIQYDVVIESELSSSVIAKYKNIVWANGEAPKTPTTIAMLEKSGKKTYEIASQGAMPSWRTSCDFQPQGQNVNIVFDGKHFSIEEAEKELLAIANHRTLGEPDNTFTSSATKTKHWVEHRWNSPQQINKIVIWWGAKETFPASYTIEIANQNQWTKIAPKGTETGLSAKSQREEIILDEPVTAEQIRVTLNEGGGGSKNPNALVIQEVEVYGADANVNIALLQAEANPALAAMTSELSASSSFALTSIPGVRLSARKSKDGYVLHLYNLNVVRLDSFHDTYEPAGKAAVEWTLPDGMNPDTLELNCYTPDSNSFTGKLPFTKQLKNGKATIAFTIPNMQIWSVIQARSTQ